MGEYVGKGVCMIMGKGITNCFDREKKKKNNIINQLIYLLENVND